MSNQEKFTSHFFNRKTDLNATIFDFSKAQRMKQVHGNNVITIDTPQKEWVEGDGIVTRTPNLPIGVITADCAPVLFYAHGVVAAAHAGWQGALNGVLDNTSTSMDVDPIVTQAFIGPSIQQQSYEVSVGFEKPFLEKHAEAERFFIAGKAGKLHFDLSGYCAFRLSLCGVKSIHIDGTDTLTHHDYYSHRGGASSSERNLSAIMLRQT
jgi:YfiH family protein